jgi:hypothetical protein
MREEKQMSQAFSKRGIKQATIEVIYTQPGMMRVEVLSAFKFIEKFGDYETLCIVCKDEESTWQFVGKVPARNNYTLVMTDDEAYIELNYTEIDLLRQQQHSDEVKQLIEEG